MSVVFRLNEHPLKCKELRVRNPKSVLVSGPIFLSSHATATGCRDLALTALLFGSGHVLPFSLAGPLGSTEQSLLGLKVSFNNLNLKLGVVV